MRQRRRCLHAVGAFGGTRRRQSAQMPCLHHVLEEDADIAVQTLFVVRCLLLQEETCQVAPDSARGRACPWTRLYMKGVLGGRSQCCSDGKPIGSALRHVVGMRIGAIGVRISTRVVFVQSAYIEFGVTCQ